MRTAFVKVWIKERELSQYVESLTYERTDEKDDYVKIRFKSDYAVNLIDDPDFFASQTIRFQYGFLGQIPSPVHITRISEIKVDYKGFIMLELKCLDGGNVMKKGNSDKHWVGSADKIVQAIAAKYGMNVSLQEKHTYQTYTSLPQTFQSDFDLLRYLARKEGAFECYVSSNTLHFKIADLGKNATRLFTYGQNIASLTIELKTAHKKKSASATINSTINPHTKGVESEMQAKGKKLKAELSQKQIKEKSAAELKPAYTDKDLVSDAKSHYFQGIQEFKERSAANVLNNTLILNKGDWDKTKKDVSPYLLKNLGTDDFSKFSYQKEGFKGSTTRIFVAQKNFNQNSNSFDSLTDSKEAKKKILTGTIEIELDTSFVLGDIVTLAGVAKRHSGNWYVHQIEDKISVSGAAMTRLTITRNASNGDYIGGSDKNTDVNTSVGNETAKAKGRTIQVKSNGILNPVSREFAPREGKPYTKPYKQ